MLSNRNNTLTAYFHPAEPSDSIRHQRVKNLHKTKQLSLISFSSSLRFDDQKS